MKKHRFAAAFVAAVLASVLAPAFATPAGAVTPYACSIGAANVGVTPGVTTAPNGASVSPTVCLYDTPTTGTEVTPNAAAYYYTTGAPGAIAGGGVAVCHVGPPVDECASAGAGGFVATTAPADGLKSIAVAGVLPSACVGWSCVGVYAVGTVWGPSHTESGVSGFVAVCEFAGLGYGCPVSQNPKVDIPPLRIIPMIIALLEEITVHIGHG